MSTAGIEKRGSAATVRACDLCRKRKRRCVWNSGPEGCTPCTNLKERCTTTHVRKQRAKPQRGTRIAEYEDRIQRLESLLQERSAAQPQVEEQPLQPADDMTPASEWVTSLRNEIPNLPRPDVSDFQEVLLEDFVDSATDQGAQSQGNSNEFAASLGSISPSTIGVLDMSENGALSAVQEDAAYLQGLDVNSSLLFQDDDLLPPPLPPTATCDMYLPPPDLGTALLSEYLVDFNTAYPLYRPHAIANHLRVCYAGVTDGSAVSWVSTYLVFGIAHMLRAMSATAIPQDMELAKYYLCRTYNSLNSLLLSPPSLGLVQCLIGVANLCRSTPCGTNVPDGHFLSTSLRVAQGLAYHDEDVNQSEDRDVEQERRVFWLAFINDTQTSLASNSPTTHRRDDIMAPVPDENPADRLGAVIAAEGHWKINIFSLRVTLALLQAEAIEQVLSVKARNIAELDLDVASTLVLARLKVFHEHELFTLSPPQLFQLLYRSDIVHAVSLEASYFLTVHRLYSFLAFGKNHRINPFSIEGLRRMSKLKEQKSFAEAKRLLSLLPIAPRGDVGLYWLQHQAFIAALVTVLAHHLGNPKEKLPDASEMRAYQALIVDLGAMVDASGNTDIAQARGLCMSMFLKLEMDMRVEWLLKATSAGVTTPDSLYVR